MCAVSVQWQFCNSIYSMISTIAKLWGDCTTTGSLLLTLCLALHGVPGPAPFPLPASPTVFHPCLPKAHHDSSSTLAGEGGGTQHPHLHGWEPTSPAGADLQPPWSWWEPQMAQGNRVLWGKSPIARGGGETKGSLHAPYHSSLHLHRGREQLSVKSNWPRCWDVTSYWQRVRKNTVYSHLLQKCPKGYFLGIRITDDSNGLHSSPWNCEDQLYLHSFA